MAISLTVIIPTLNEGESIGPTIDQIPRNLPWLDVKVLIVDGNSTDNTAEEAEKRGAIVHNEPRKGYGRAYKTGFSIVDTDYVATIDGDTTYPDDKIPHVLAFLINNNLDFVKTAWPHVKKAIEFSLSLQTEDGDIRWAAETDTTRVDDALITGCSSIFKSLNSSLKLAELAIFDPDSNRYIRKWTAARDKLRDALVHKPYRFDRNWQPKDNFSMDWYYPVLTGVLEGEAAKNRLDEKWDVFVVDKFGCKCVSDEPWVTVAETAELVMALVKVGRKNQAKEILSWLDKFRDEDGGYWMGYQTEHKMNWPLEKPPWTSGAVILATDAVFDITPASKLFSQ